MAIYRMADLNIDIQNEHQYTSRICKDYLAPDGVHADMTAFPNPAEYEADRKVVPTATDGYLEGLSVYRCIARKILAFDGFVMHASVVERGGTAYAFCAKSGTGKTTHSRLWLKAFPDARIINGDKPLLRLADGRFWIYGTPWCGKENYQVNTKAPLGGICFIERAPTNSITRLSKRDAVSRLFIQLLLPKEQNEAEKQLDLAGKLIDCTPAFLLRCNMDVEAAEVAYSALSAAKGE